MTVIDVQPTSAGPDPDDLLHLLLEFFWDTATIKGIGREIKLDLARVFWEQSATELWPEFLTVAAEQQLVPALLKRITSDRVGVEVARRFRPFLTLGPAAWPGRRSFGPTTLTNQTPPGPSVGADGDPYAVAMVGPRPLIDRTELRRHLRQMHGPDGSRVLVVSGKDGCGKSHTWFAISHLAERLGTFQARSVDLSRRAGGPAQLTEVMELIAARLFGGSPAPVSDPLAQDETRINRFLGWLTSETESFTKPVWLVFDGFVPACASPGAQQLVTAIAMATDRQELPNLRVTILGFAGRLGPDVLGYALRDTPGHPQPDDLRRFFRAFAERHRTQVDDEGIEVLMEPFLADPAGLAALEMAELSRWAHQLAAAAFGTTDA